MIVNALVTKTIIGFCNMKIAMHMILADAQGFLSTSIKWASAGVSAFGAGFIISGIIDLGEGNSQQSAAKKNEGISKIVGGIMVVLVGIALVPQIQTIFP